MNRTNFNCVLLISIDQRGFFMSGNKSNGGQLKEGAVVVVTGASSGLGKEIALLLSARKLRIVITGRDQFRLNEVADQCRQLGEAEVSTFIGDLVAEDTCRKLIIQVQQAYSRIDCLILNAGVNAHFQFESLKDVSVFENLMRVNFYANVYLSRWALPHLKKSGGKIVVVSSLSGKFGLPSRSAYCASKFALTGFFQSLRTETQVPIMMVYPTSLETPMRQNSLIKAHNEAQEKRQDPKKCAQMVIKGLDNGVEDIYLPFKGWVGVALQPLFPRFIRRKLIRAAKL